MSTLVIYASDHGSTQEVAERIATRLTAQHQLAATALPVDRVTAAELLRHRHVLVGSAVHNFAWLPRAEAFLATHRAGLAALPVWAFSVGFAGGAPRVMFGKKYEDKEGPLLEAYVRERVDGCKGHVLFEGRFGRRDTGKLFTVVWAVTGGRFGDRREWGVIDAWADAVAGEIKGLGE